jgi:hypothetical protein
MKTSFKFLFLIFAILLFQRCQKNPVDLEESHIPPEQPNLLAIQTIDVEVASVMDTTLSQDANAKQGGIYAAIVRDIIFTNPFIGIPLLATAAMPVQHPQAGVWIWQKQIFQAQHELKAIWDGDSGYDWNYVWKGGLYQNYLALEGHTDILGLNGTYTLYYNDFEHSIYGVKEWSVEPSHSLTINWVRYPYQPLNVPKRVYLGHFFYDKSGDLTFWENDNKRFYITWNSDDTGYWEIWLINGNHIQGTF